MKNWLKGFLASIGELLKSKKVLTVVGTAVAVKYLPNLDAETRKGLIELGTGLVLAQGAADFGKSKAQQTAGAPAAPRPAPPLDLSKLQVPEAGLGEVYPDR